MTLLCVTRSCPQPPKTAQNDAAVKAAFNSVVYAVGDAISSSAIGW